MNYDYIDILILVNYICLYMIIYVKYYEGSLI